MNDANFYDPAAQAAVNPDQARLAEMLMRMQRNNGQLPQSQVNGNGNALGGANQLAGTALGAWGRMQQADANKAATALNGGTPTIGQTPAPFSRFGQFLGGLGG